MTDEVKTKTAKYDAKKEIGLLRDELSKTNDLLERIKNAVERFSGWEVK